MMKQYRDADVVNEELHDTHSIIAKTREFIKQYPQDEALQLVLKQEEREIERLTKELEESLVYSRRHVLKYAIQTGMSKFRLDKLSEMTTGLQDVLNKSLQFVSGKQRAVSPLYLNTTYKGSFGLMLSTDSEDSLLDDDRDKALNFMFDTIEKMDTIVSSENSHELLMKHFNSNTKVMAKFKHFYKTISDSDNDIKLEWLEYKKEPKELYIKNSSAKKLYNFFQQKEESVEKDIVIKGMIKGISLLKDEIEFQTDEKISFKAKFPKNMSETLENLFNTNVVATFNKITKINFTSSSESETWEIVRVKREDKAK